MKRTYQLLAAAIVAVLVTLFFRAWALSCIRESLDTPAPTPAATAPPADQLLAYRGPRFNALDLPVRDIAASFVKTQTQLLCRQPIRRCRFGLFEIKGADLAGTPIKFVLSDHLAGAVYRVVYGDVDFVQPVPIVGASMQTAMSFDIRAGGSNEQYNPTEAGCEGLDSFTERSSSRLRMLRASDSAVFTQVRPAYFKAPGSLLEPREEGGQKIPVLNKTVLSEVLHSKRIQFVAPGVADYHMRCFIPDKHFASQIEALCCWVPAQTAARAMAYFNKEWVELESLPEGPYWVNSYGKNTTGGLLVGTEDGSRAMGVVVMDWPRGIMAKPPHYNFFPSERTLKWNIVQKLGDPSNYSVRLPGGALNWKFRLFFGTVAEVQAAVAGVQADIPLHGRDYGSFKALFEGLPPAVTIAPPASPTKEPQDDEAVGTTTKPTKPTAPKPTRPVADGAAMSL